VHSSYGSHCSQLARGHLGQHVARGGTAFVEFALSTYALLATDAGLLPWAAAGQRTCGAAIDDAGARHLALEVQHLLADLGGLAATVRDQVFGLVTLVKHDKTIEFRTAPLNQLVQAREALQVPEPLSLPRQEST